MVVAGDRGISQQAYNSAVIRLAERALQADVALGRSYTLICVGKKVDDYFKFRGYKIDATFRGFSEAPSYENARQVAESVVQRFDAGEIDEVNLAYTQFLSAGSRPRRAAALHADRAGRHHR